jgi:hypothetical protein
MVDPPAFRRWKRGKGSDVHQACNVGTALRSLRFANRRFRDRDLADAIDLIETFIDCAEPHVREAATEVASQTVILGGQR